MNDALRHIHDNYLFDVCELEQVNDNDLQVNVKEGEHYATYVFTFYESTPINTNHLEDMIKEIYGGEK